MIGTDSTYQAIHIETVERSNTDLQHKSGEPLRFETLLAKISAQFINFPADQIDSGIEDAQRRVCEYLGLDLSAVWQWSPESPIYLTLTHLHSPPAGPSRPERIGTREFFPWQFGKKLRGETLAFSTEQLPTEAVDRLRRVAGQLLRESAE